MRRGSALAASAVGVLILAACGGGGGGGGGGGKTSVSGTAAEGAALAGATLTLVDATGATATATTATDGTFTIDTTGLTPPFMIKLVSGGTTLFSVSAEASADTVINVTPLTDLILRTWYDVQGVEVDAAFAAPVADPPPSPEVVAVIGQVVQRIVQLWLDQAGVSGDFNLITTPFVADGSGIDQVMDWITVYEPSTGDITITDGTTTQNTSYLASDGSIAVDTTTDGAAGSSSSSTSTVVPVNPPQQTALEAIAALVDQFAATVNAEGASLAAADLLPYMDPSLLADGWGRASYAAFLAGNLSQVTNVSFAPINVLALDEVGGTAEMSYQLSMSMGGETAIQILGLFFKKVGGSWLLSGNGRLAELELRTGMVVNQGAVANEGATLEVNVAAPENTVTGATITGGPWTSAALNQGAQKDTPAGWRDGFQIWDQTSIVAGTEFSLTVTPATGTPQTYTLVSNAVTSEAIRFTGLSVTTVGAFGLDSAHAMTWTLPKTFSVAFVRLGRVAYDGDPNDSNTHACETSQTLAASATTGSVTIPSDCGNGTVAAEVYVQAWGAAGEFTTAYYMLEPDPS